MEPASREARRVRARRVSDVSFQWGPHHLYIYIARCLLCSHTHTHTAQTNTQHTGHTKHNLYAMPYTEKGKNNLIANKNDMCVMCPKKKQLRECKCIYKSFFFFCWSQEMCISHCALNVLFPMETRRRQSMSMRSVAARLIQSCA